MGNVLNRPRFAGVELTEASLQEAREWYRDSHLACIKAAETGAYKVNNLKRYVERHKSFAEQAMDQSQRMTVAFLQRAHFIQTGESVALLPGGD